MWNKYQWLSFSQTKKTELTQPFSQTPMLVIDKNNGMITARSDNKIVTRNSFHFKKLTVSERKGGEINENTSHNKAITAIKQNDDSFMQHPTCEYKAANDQDHITTRQSKRLIQKPARLI